MTRPQTHLLLAAVLLGLLASHSLGVAGRPLPAALQEARTEAAAASPSPSPPPVKGPSQLTTDAAGSKKTAAAAPKAKAPSPSPPAGRAPPVLQRAKQQQSEPDAGTAAAAGQFPFVVAVYERNASAAPASQRGSGAGKAGEAGEAQLCGGSLVAPNVVLTTADCACGGGSCKKGLFVRAGLTRADNTSAPAVDVARVYTHPKWQSYMPDGYDVALLLLGAPLDNVPVVKLASSKTELKAGQALTVTGFGELPSNSNITALLYAHTINVPYADCNAKLVQELGIGIPSSMMCAESESSAGVCLGQTGAPLLAQDGKEAVQVGMPSFRSTASDAAGAQHTCGGAGSVNAYADLRVAYSWIEGMLKKVAARRR